MHKVDSKTNPVRRFCRRMTELYEHRPVLYSAALALLLALVLEMLGRHSLLKGVAFFFAHPVNFLVNALIILTTLSICRFFRRRVYFFNLTAGLWLVMGVANGVVRCFRATPLEAVDISILPSAVTIIGVYIDAWLIVLLVFLLAAGLAALVYAFFKADKRAPSYKQTAVFVLVCASLTALGYGATVWGRQDERAEVYSNIIDAYDQYGFVYCFATGAVDRGIEEPELYSQTTVKGVLRRLDWRDKPETLPDIVMVQLESFFDVARLDDVSYEEDPIPAFRRLKEESASGYLTVPSVGAGTANTEFEVLSGMSLNFFGLGEYPYMTILQEEACETVATDLKDLGYTAHAIHNNTGTFYMRNKVFAQLGFDTYTSLEFMNGIEYNPIGWAKDAILTGEIVKALDSSDAPHFVFAVTVQGHGKYQPGVDSAETEGLDVAWMEDMDDQDAFAYYVSQLRETDAFIADLADTLARRGKPAVLVLYGDHLPNFDIGSEQLKNGSIFQTEYVIWSNMDLNIADRDLCAYQLSAQVLQSLGMDGGILTRYHQKMQGKTGYQEGLRLLEYDMLYGEDYCYGGVSPYTASDLQMGLYPIEVEKAVWAEGVLTVSGRNFTAWSRIALDGDELNTVLNADGTVSAELDDPPERGTALTIRQRAVNKSGILAESNAYIWP